MPISNMQWRKAVQIFNDTSKASYLKKKSLRVASPAFNSSVLFFFSFILLTLFVCGEAELNPGPKNRNSCYNFSICDWNLNSITAHNFAKTNLLQAYNTIHDFDMVCLSESYLDSSVSSANENLYIKDYKLVRPDHPGNAKSGWSMPLFYRIFTCKLSN